MKRTLTGIIPIPFGEEPVSNKHYTLSDIPFLAFSDAGGGNMLQYPRTGLTLIHGYRTGIKDLHLSRLYYQKNGYDIIPVTLEIKKITFSTNRYTLNDLPNYKILHLDMAMGDLRKYILSLLYDFAKEEGTPFETSSKVKKSNSDMSIIMTRPHLLDRLHAHEDFKHIKLMYYPVRTDRRITSFATLFESDLVEGVYSLYYPELKIRLPDWLP